MSPILIPSNLLRETKRLFIRLKHTRAKLPVLTHILLTAGPDGIHLTVTDLDHWLQTCVSSDGLEPVRFLIPPAAMDAACRADRASLVSFTTRGGRRSKELSLAILQGGIEASSVHPTLDPKEFPDPPDPTGDHFIVPPATIQNLAVVAGCASKDATRQILNGVYLTPEDGGQLVATDGRHLACCPADVSPRPFVLPNRAVSILAHPCFSSDLVTLTWLKAKDSDFQHVAIRCGCHLLIAGTLAGNYPNFRQVIPMNAKQLAVIPHDRRPGVIAWLRSFGSKNKPSCSVRLDWKKRGQQNGQLTLTHGNSDGHSSALSVPVEIHGNPPVIAFNPHYLADALEIGSTLCLSDEMSPGICRHPTGRFCVIMPMRVTIPTANPTGEAEAPSEQPAQTAA